jgi:uncharacterized membrane protein YeaQ/YmgE (transglycosylase-associated protein family)
MLIIGLIVGGLAKLVIPGKDPGGLVITMLIGVAGAVLAGMLGRSFGWYETGEGAGFVAAVVGAIILLVSYKFVLRRQPS